MQARTRLGGELMQRIVRRLRRDWGEAFVRVVGENTRNQHADGRIAMRFDARLVVDPNEVSQYLTGMLEDQEITDGLLLRKDALRWGILEGDDGDHEDDNDDGNINNINESNDGDNDESILTYVCLPPWAHLPTTPMNGRGIGSLSPRSTSPTRQHSSHGTALLSGRIPFMPQTASGTPIEVFVSIHNRTFRY
eukprot:jgi/Chlat1/5999/Chrsp4S06307